MVSFQWFLTSCCAVASMLVRVSLVVCGAVAVASPVTDSLPAILAVDHEGKDFIRKGNEYLQACIDYKKVLFASRTCSNDKVFDNIIGTTLPKDLIFTGDKADWTNLDFIENQDDFIYQTKKQCALVEYTTTSRGMQNFDLPQHLKRGSSATRARKDNYSAFMLANWGVKCYNDIMKQTVENNTFTFTPVMF